MTPLKSLLALLVVFLLNKAEGQTIEPDVMNTAGFSWTDNMLYVSSNIGEAIIGTLELDNQLLTMGYLQPAIDGPCKDVEFTYFPNPTLDILNIETSDCDKIASINIIDAFGRVVAKAPLQKGKVDLTGINPGIYIIQPEFLDGSVSDAFKIVKVSN